MYRISWLVSLVNPPKLIRTFDSYLTIPLRFLKAKILLILLLLLMQSTGFFTWISTFIVLLLWAWNVYALLTKDCSKVAKRIGLKLKEAGLPYYLIYFPQKLFFFKFGNCSLFKSRSALEKRFILILIQFLEIFFEIFWRSVGVYWWVS